MQCQRETSADILSCQSRPGALQPEDEDAGEGRRLSSQAEQEDVEEGDSSRLRGRYRPHLRPGAVQYHDRPSHEPEQQHRGQRVPQRDS